MSMCGDRILFRGAENAGPVFQPFASRPNTFYLPMKTAMALTASGTGKEKA